MSNEFWDQASVSGALAPQAYQQLAKDQKLSRGSTQALALPQVIPGFVVGRSSLNGAPAGWSDRNVAARVNVDTDIPGESFVADLSQMTKEAAEAATEAAGVRDAFSIEDLRARASQAYQRFAVGTKLDTELQPEGAHRPMPQSAQPLMPSPAPVPGVAAPVAPAAPPAAIVASPVPAQPLPPAPVAPAPVAPAVAPSLFSRMAPAPAAPTGVARQASVNGAPAYKVTFEIKGGLAVVEAWYHQVIRNQQTLALCYDTTIVGFPRTKLQPTKEDIALHIEGSDSIYLVQDPGMSFVHGGEEIQIFMIKLEAPYEVGGQPPAEGA